MAIYTKKGDSGKTGLFSSKERISKDSLRIRAIGSIDEANSFLGIVCSFSNDPFLTRSVKEVQRNLFKIGSSLAGAKMIFSPAAARKLEKEIRKALLECLQNQ